MNKLNVISWIFTDEEIDFIVDNYVGLYNQELTDKLNETFNKNSYTQVKRFKTKHKPNSGITGYFEKGQKPFNKGLTLKIISQEKIEKIRKTWYKKGQKSHNKKPVS